MVVLERRQLGRCGKTRRTDAVGGDDDQQTELGDSGHGKQQCSLALKWLRF